MFEDRGDCQHNTFWAGTKKLRRRDTSSYLVSAAGVLLPLCLQAVDNRYLSTQNPSTALCPVRGQRTPDPYNSQLTYDIALHQNYLQVG